MSELGSRDGTSIAYERLGDGGPAVLLVGGGAVDRSENAPLAAELAGRFRVYNFDRRGRGDSGDSVPYGAHGWSDYVTELRSLLAQGRRGDAFALFMRVAGSSEEDIAAARASDVWPACEAIAHTLAYDAACLGDGQVPTQTLARVTQPTLVITGGAAEFFESAADAVADALPHARREVLTGQTHVVDAKVLAPLLADFFE